MIDYLEDLAILYNKKEAGIATKEDCMTYDFLLSISSLREDVLMMEIKRRAKRCKTSER